jgi:hypothetical protein
MMSSGEGMRGVSPKENFTWTTPCKSLYAAQEKTLEEHGSSDSTATEDQHGGNSDTPDQAD